MQRFTGKPDTEVLIVGAGPTGLALAISLACNGIRPRIVDRRTSVAPQSRAMIVHARTLELYAAVGLADTAVTLGRKVEALSSWRDGKELATIALGDIGAGLSPFPFMLSLPQDVHERMLEARLADLGVGVERGSELIDFADVDDAVIATLAHANGEREALRVDYLCGCDGLHSATRESLGIGFPGGAYQERFFVADVHASGPLVNGRLNVVLGKTSFAGVFPLSEDGWCRVIGVVPREIHDKPELGEEDIAGIVAATPGLLLGAVDWTSVFHVHHRVAERFRAGRVFLLGDAAHVHSPAGGQGMNTGIGDAFNLGWKLATVIRGDARPSLLDTYESERRPFAEKLLATTDLAFRNAVAPGRLARVLRLSIMPRLLAVAARIPPLRRTLFRTVSQIGISYRGSALGAAGAGAVAPGDRMPWVGPGRGSHRAMDAATWHLVVIGAASPELARYAAGNDLDVLEIPPARVGRSRLQRDAAYLVRPDGHIACIAWWQQPAILEAYRRERGLVWCGDATGIRSAAPAAKDVLGARVAGATVADAQPAGH